jgi:hypothetical protein
VSSAPPLPPYVFHAAPPPSTLRQQNPRDQQGSSSSRASDAMAPTDNDANGSSVPLQKPLPLLAQARGAYLVTPARRGAAAGAAAGARARQPLPLLSTLFAPSPDSHVLSHARASLCALPLVNIHLGPNYIRPQHY